MKQRGEGFLPGAYGACAAATLVVMLLCVCLGSVNIPLPETLRAIAGTAEDPMVNSVIRAVRIPRVLCTALVGAALSIAGAAMQGILKNPLADGSTLGVSSGASLGAVIAMTVGAAVPSLPFGGTVGMAMLFSFLSLWIILGLAYRLDHSMTTNTIILIGVIFSMFASSIISLLITFAPEHTKTIMFWTMGSLAGSSYQNALLLLCALTACGGMLLELSGELNAFALGEENAAHIGVDVKRVKLMVLISVSALIGVCVSVGGTIGFVGLVVPHMTRMLTGANHKRLLPGSLFFGGIFLMLGDLAARLLLRPMELPIGVITSFTGSIAFVLIFFRSRRAGRC